MTETPDRKTDKAALSGLCAVLSMVLRPVVWLGESILSVLAALSHVRDFFVFVAHASSLPIRMAIYCVMTSFIVFVFWNVVKYGLSLAGVL